YVKLLHRLRSHPSPSPRKTRRPAQPRRPLIPRKPNTTHQRSPQLTHPQTALNSMLTCSHPM
ncbi:hypothetical protein BCR44DRAFT_1427941, partial [Catenaria anguillulae PL171]